MNREIVKRFNNAYAKIEQEVERETSDIRKARLLDQLDHITEVAQVVMTNDEYHHFIWND